MIKEKKKKNKRQELNLKQEISRYVKTAGISFAFALIFTLLLSFQARTEMIRNLYVSNEEKSRIERKIAQQIVAHSDLTATIRDKSYIVAMQVGDLYDAAGDLQRAEYAYHIATQKSPNGKYLAHLKLATVLITRGKIQDAIDLIDSVEDVNTLSLVRFKARAYIVLGDKYYSEGLFLKASSAYEQANYYYNSLTKKDKVVRASIEKRLVNAYVETASVIVKNGYNSDAVRYLKKALKYDPDNLKIQYRLALVYADLDPVESIKYFEPLVAKIPQDIDYMVYSKALMKAANIKDIQGDTITAKYYRYKIHSLDLYINQKVIYKDDVEVILESFIVKKILFSYKLKSKYTIKNISAQDIKFLNADFVLRQGEKEKDFQTINIANKKQPLFSNGGEKSNIEVKFGKNIFTKRELKQYYIDIYLYKDKHFKELVQTIKVPTKSVY